MKQFTFLSLAILLLGCWPVLSQNRTITGTVVGGSDNEPLVGATVVVSGTQIGTTTLSGGKFELGNVPQTAETLDVSFIGYVSQTVAIARNMKITLQSDSEVIDDIVVIGYGAVKKSDLTGSVASVKSEELMKSSPTNLQQGMQGRIAGVNVVSNDGAPGAGMSIQIRGTNSFMGGTEPLYVIDGVPVTTFAGQESVSLVYAIVSYRQSRGGGCERGGGEGR